MRNFCSTIGQTLIQGNFYACKTAESFGYMLSSVRRRVLDVKDEAQLIELFRLQMKRILTLSQQQQRTGKNQ